MSRSRDEGDTKPTNNVADPAGLLGSYVQNISIGSLNEFFTRCNLNPKYEVVSKPTEQEPDFMLKMTLGKMNSMGIGKTKRMAKQSAIMQLLRTIIPCPDVNDPDLRRMRYCAETLVVFTDESLPNSLLDALQKLCGVRQLSQPVYRLVCEGLAQSFVNVVTCTVDTTTVVGMGKTKKRAKRHAAFKMLFYFMFGPGRLEKRKNDDESPSPVPSPAIMVASECSVAREEDELTELQSNKSSARDEDDASVTKDSLDESEEHHGTDEDFFFADCDWRPRRRAKSDETFAFSRSLLAERLTPESKDEIDAVSLLRDDMADYVAEQGVFLGSPKSGSLNLSQLSHPHLDVVGDIPKVVLCKEDEIDPFLLTKVAAFNLEQAFHDFREGAAVMPIVAEYDVKFKGPKKRRQCTTQRDCNVMLDILQLGASADSSSRSKSQANNPFCATPCPVEWVNKTSKQFEGGDDNFTAARGLSAFPEHLLKATPRESDENDLVKTKVVRLLPTPPAKSGSDVFLTSLALDQPFTMDDALRKAQNESPVSTSSVDEGSSERVTPPVLQTGLFQTYDSASEMNIGIEEKRKAGVDFNVKLTDLRQDKADSNETPSKTTDFAQSSSDNESPPDTFTVLSSPAPAIEQQLLAHLDRMANKVITAQTPSTPVFGPHRMEHSVQHHHVIQAGKQQAAVSFSSKVTKRGKHHLEESTIEESPEETDVKVKQSSGSRIVVGWEDAIDNTLTTAINYTWEPLFFSFFQLLVAFVVVVEVAVAFLYVFTGVLSAHQMMFSMLHTALVVLLVKCVLC